MFATASLDGAVADAYTTELLCADGLTGYVSRESENGDWIV